MSHQPANLYPTPYEQGNQNQTTNLGQCISFYETLAAAFPTVLNFKQIGVSDNGIPMHAGVDSLNVAAAAAVFLYEAARQRGKV